MGVVMSKLTDLVAKVDAFSARVDAVERELSKVEKKRAIEGASNAALHSKLKDSSLTPEGRKMIERELDDRANSGRSGPFR